MGKRASRPVFEEKTSLRNQDSAARNLCQAALSLGSLAEEVRTAATKHESNWKTFFAEILGVQDPHCLRKSALGEEGIAKVIMRETSKADHDRALEHSALPLTAFHMGNL